MRIVSYRAMISWLSVLVAAPFGAAGCLGSADLSLGTMDVNLVGHTPSGATYRLRDASIVVTGPAPTTWNTEDDLNRTSLSAAVVAGNYVATLQAGWRLERLDASAATPVSAQLITANPVSFTVAPGARTSVPLQFLVNAEPVDMSQGYDITLGVEEPSTTTLFVLNQVLGRAGWAGITMYPSNSRGDQVPIQTIVGSENALLGPYEMVVANEEIFVADLNTSAIQVYPMTASGQVAPSRVISGPTTQIDFTRSVTVRNDEIYVGTPNKVLVFPLRASGDVAPTRVLQTPASVVSLTTYRDELYVTEWTLTSTSIAVYAATASGSAAPRRVLTGMQCPVNVAFVGDEMFVADECRGVLVYPTNASGNPRPSRELTRWELDEGELHVATSETELYVTLSAGTAVEVFPLTASGHDAPARTISGPHTNLGFPMSMQLH